MNVTTLLIVDNNINYSLDTLIRQDYNLHTLLVILNDPKNIDSYNNLKKQIKNYKLLYDANVVEMYTGITSRGGLIQFVRAKEEQNKYDLINQCIRDTIESTQVYLLTNTNYTYKTNKISRCVKEFNDMVGVVYNDSNITKREYFRPERHMATDLIGDEYMFSANYIQKIGGFNKHVAMPIYEFTLRFGAANCLHIHVPETLTISEKK